MLRLPEQHRRPRRGGHDDAGPEPPAGQQPLCPRREQHADQDAEHQHDGQLLVDQAESGHDTRHEPEPVVAGPQDAQHEPGKDDPHEQVDRRGDEQVPGQEYVRGRSSSAGGQDLAEPSAAELSGHESGQQRDAGGRGDSRQPEDGQRPMPDAVHDPGQDRRQRWLVRVAPGEVSTAGEEVELVAEAAVTPAQREQDDSHRSGHHRQRPPSDRRRPGVVGHQCSGPDQLSRKPPRKRRKRPPTGGSGAAGGGTVLAGVVIGWS